MSYRDTHDDVEVPIKLSVIRQWRDTLAREQVNSNNNLLRRLWGQVAGTYQQLVKLAANTTRAKAAKQDGTPSVQLQKHDHLYGG